MRTYMLYTVAARDSVPFAPSIRVQGDRHDTDVDGGFYVYKNDKLVAFVPGSSLLGVKID